MLTDRDAKIVAALDETGGLDLASIQLMFGMHRTSAYRRVERMEQYGMITAARPFLRAPAFYMPTARGLRELVGREDLKAPSVGPGTYTHKVHVAHVLAELEHHGVRWQSERRTRRNQKAAEAAGDTREANRYSIELSWLEQRHRPDLLMWPSQTAIATEQPVAVEVELAQKSKSRLDEILSGYATALDMAGVVYVAGPHALQAVREAVGRLGDRAHVVQVASIYEFGPHFGAPKVGGRPGRREAVETEPRAAAGSSWIAEHLTEGPISVLEERLRGPQGATPSLLQLRGRAGSPSGSVSALQTTTLPRSGSASQLHCGATRVPAPARSFRRRRPPYRRQPRGSTAYHVVPPLTMWYHAIAWRPAEPALRTAACRGARSGRRGSSPLPRFDPAVAIASLTCV